MASKTSFMMSAKGASIFIDGKTYVFSHSHTNFERACQAARDKEWDIIPELVSVPEVIQKLNVGNLIFKNRVLHYNDRPVASSYVIEKLLQMLDTNQDYQPLARFVENLFANPSEDSRDELYGFLERSSLPITTDGHFLAYKRVRGDYKDCHSKSIDNSVGRFISMCRDDVDSDRNQVCSHGLHVCSKEYLKNFSGARMMICKVNPRDVVSVPKDYGNTKMRVCAYQVVDEMLEEYIPEFEENAVYEDDDQPFVPHKVGFLSRLRAFFPNN